MDIKINEKTEILGRIVEIMVCDTGSGANILICGGDRSHIGAVAAAAPGFDTQVITFAGHREDVVVRRWAEAVSQKANIPVTCEAGIHFDNINKEDICTILECLEKNLEKILKHF